MYSCMYMNVFVCVLTCVNEQYVLLCICSGQTTTRKILGTFSGCLLFPGSMRLPLISRIIYFGRHGELILYAFEN